MSRPPRVLGPVFLCSATFTALAAASGPASEPDDPRFHQQWGLETTGAAQAWALTTGSTRVTVGVLDTGVDYTHADLYLNVRILQDEIPPGVRALLADVDGDGLITFRDLADPGNQGPGRITDLNGNGYVDGGDLLRPVAQGGWVNGVDDGANGFVDDLIGWDFFDGDNDPMDTDPLTGHGTFIAGIIGAVGDNAEGIAGLNWRVGLLPLRVRPHLGDLTPAQVLAVVGATVDAGHYGAAQGMRVANFSVAVPPALLAPESVAAIDGLFDALAAADVFAAAAAGNAGVDVDVHPHLPGTLAHENIVNTAATDRHDRLAAFSMQHGSNFGAAGVDLGAPGLRIWSTLPTHYPGRPYGHSFGTSYAAPHVAGTAALMLSRNPDLSAAQIKAGILGSVDPIGGLAGVTVSGGRLNVFGAVASTPVP